MNLQQLIDADREYGVSPMQTMVSMSGMEFLQAMIDGKLPTAPIMKTLKFALTKIEPGVAVFEGIPDFDTYNPIGSVHGGYIGTLLDSALGCCVHTMMTAGQAYTTLEFKVSFIKAVTRDTGPVRAEGRVLNVGRRAATAEARLTDAAGRLLAHGTTTCLVFDVPGAAKPA